MKQRITNFMLNNSEIITKSTYVIWGLLIVEITLLTFLIINN